ncbi:Dam family site-specific DNA-(adenine-N6)-methyltransferase [Fulvivirgaceae bacterium BMA10]|uniref:Site-specific DNA-methyltransferase (adenine-specific) n=1 Tax=Splendidivirga corallicola TaxID=3051826 RepID=A0ABT8KU08_9BACT|nr:Dam family site-specific DNA-(adenine-N6)-methyltransferase [Fulvivirgaceae bacterium BMA10]
MNKEVNASTKPFLRWAGGKNWLVKNINNYLPIDGFNNYIEPFLGGGSIFFHLAPQKAILSDLNKELIETYKALRSNVNEIIDELSKFRNDEKFYYQIRSKKIKSDIKKAAKFIYLNQTSFNGIYRVNLKGEYNVPFGHRKKDFLQPENLLKASKSLQFADIKTRDFYDSLNDIQKNDLVFLDPPYTVTHNNNGFIKYNSKLFDLDAQRKLSAFIDCLAEIGAYYILTNAAHMEVKNIFSKPNNYMIEISRASLVGGMKAKRGKYSELIFTNIDRHG